MIALALAFILASAAALDCNCDCDGTKKVATVDKCSDCVADKCKTSFATECGSAAVVSSNCNTSGDDTDNQFTCTIEQAFKGLECVGGDCLLAADPANAKYCECKQRGADCARKAGCIANKQSESQVAACKKECPSANYCNGAESMMMSTVALVAAVAFVRL